MITHQQLREYERSVLTELLGRLILAAAERHFVEPDYIFGFDDVKKILLNRIDTLSVSEKSAAKGITQ